MRRAFFGTKLDNRFRNPPERLHGLVAQSDRVFASESRDRPADEWRPCPLRPPARLLNAPEIQSPARARQLDNRLREWNFDDPVASTLPASAVG
jgi:hypothetical protein